MIEGMVQEIEYGENGGTTRLYYATKVFGKDRIADAVPTIAISDPGGTAIVTATNMTAVTPDPIGGHGFLPWDTGTADFNQGALLTGGTSKATAHISGVLKYTTITGLLYLSNIYGTFVNNETITDDQSGSALVNSTTGAVVNEYYYQVDASSTTVYDDAEDYIAEIEYVYGAITYHDTRYFDVVRHPFSQPLISSVYIDLIHPDWKYLLPQGQNADYTEIIKMTHAELAMKIRQLGNRPSFIVQREQLWPIELAMVEGNIAMQFVEMTTESRNFYIKQKENAINKIVSTSFKWDIDDDAQLDEGVKILSSELTR